MRTERTSRLHDIILKRLAEARDRYGHSFELKHIEGNWGDTTNDQETLADITRYLETGEFLPSKPMLLVRPDAGAALSRDARDPAPGVAHRD